MKRRDEEVERFGTKWFVDLLIKFTYSYSGVESMSILLQTLELPE